MNTTTREFIALPSRNDVSRADFWLCLWIRRDLMVKALEAHIDRNPGLYRTDEALEYALQAGLWKVKFDADDAIETLRESGGLLFAFADTTRPAHAMKGGAL